MSKIILCETPHLVIQGEGNLIGKKMLLCRVAGCDVQCVNCDTPYSWNSSNNISYDYKSFVEMLRLKKVSLKYDYVMITGGAPSLHKDFLYQVIHNNNDLLFQIEDAGNQSWKEFKNFENVWFSFSPKIGSLKGSTDIVDWKAFDNLPRNWICKVVVAESEWEESLKDIQAFQKKYSIPDDKIYIMPLGTHRDEIVSQSSFLISKCWEYGFNFTSRLHVLLFDNSRMV